MRRRLLAFPWPVGAGHTGRCLALARVLGEDYEVVFASDPTGGMVASAGSETVRAGARRGMPALPSVTYLAITGPEDAFASMGYHRASRIRDEVEADRELIRRLRPDAVITHMHPTSVIAARCEGVPVVSVADADFFVTGPFGWMPWLGDGQRQLSRFPGCLGVFNDVLATYRQKAVDECSDLLLGDVTLIASVPEVERPDRRYASRPDMHYIGPLIWDSDARGELAARLRSFTGSGRIRVYASAGGGALSTHEFAGAARVAAVLGSWSLVLSGGIGDVPVDMDERNVLHHSFGGITSASAWADVVVCHGGHSTILAALLAGKPVVVVPSMSENEGNGRYLVSANGVGVVVVTSSVGDGGRLVLTPRRPLETDAGLVDGSGLVDAVSELVGDPTYRRKAAELSDVLHHAVREAPARLRSLLGDIGL
jgi:UDP:flavonoid glycosyltransferase YjiC (YdhE family)